MKKIGRLFYLGCLLVLNASSQEVYHFKNGLAVTTPVRYGREAVYTDDLAYQLYTKTLKAPVEGSQFGSGEKGEAVVWQTVGADSANRLLLKGQSWSGGFGRGGYIYLTYASDRERTTLLNMTGNSGLFFNGEPHAGDPYRLGWLHIPVKLKKGLNEIYARGLFITASLSFPSKPVLLNTDDPTLPSIVLNGDNKDLQGAVVVIKTSFKELTSLQVKSKLAGREVITSLPAIPAMSIRKVPFHFDGNGVGSAGKQGCQLALVEKGKVLDEARVPVEAVATTD